MALLECPFGHADCPGHKIEPILTGLPNADPPKAGRCKCGSLDYLWYVPRWSVWLCRHCYRATMRRATWPQTIRFPDEVG